MTFDDHFSQASLFYRSPAPLEQDHVVAADTFELSKCYEQVIRERQLLALAYIDSDLCQRVATGLGLDAPAPTVTFVKTATTAAISQLGGTWPVAGRTVGVVIGADSDPAGIAAVRGALIEADVSPLMVGPHGGKIGTIAVQRTYANAASTEFDAVIGAARQNHWIGARRRVLDGDPATCLSARSCPRRPDLCRATDH